jgi:hypothetical protein
MMICKHLHTTAPATSLAENANTDGLFRLVQLDSRASRYGRSMRWLVTDSLWCAYRIVVNEFRAMESLDLSRCRLCTTGLVA